MFAFFKRIGAIAAASVLALATVEQPAMAISIPSGVYTIDRQLHADQSWEINVTTAVATRKEFKINIVYQNVSNQEQRLYCTPGKQRLYVHGTRRIETLRTYCSAHEGEELSVQPGDVLESFGVFPNSFGLAAPFDLSWYRWGTVEGITLR